MKSQSPTVAEPIVGLTFTDALDRMLAGRKVRHGAMDPDAYFALRGDWLQLVKGDGTIHSPQVHRQDLEATDWRVVLDQ